MYIPFISFRLCNLSIISYNFIFFGICSFLPKSSYLSSASLKRFSLVIEKKKRTTFSFHIFTRNSCTFFLFVFIFLYLVSWTINVFSVIRIVDVPISTSLFGFSFLQIFSFSSIRYQFAVFRHTHNNFQSVPKNILFLFWWHMPFL